MKKSTEEHFAKYISQIYRKGRVLVTGEFSEKGVSSSQVMFLTQLYKKDGISQEELSEELSIDKGTTARAIKKLEEQGFITREKDELDKRANKIYLTSKSLNDKEDILSSVRKWEDQVLEDITKEEREVLMSILKKICTSEYLK